jgi:hypothetical protein
VNLCFGGSVKWSFKQGRLTINNFALWNLCQQLSVFVEYGLMVMKICFEVVLCYR